MAECNGGHQPHQGQYMLAETETRMLEVMGSSAAPVESEETTDSRKGVQANNHTPERTDKSTIDTQLPSTAGAWMRVVKPPKRSHLKEVLVHAQRGGNQQTQ